MEEAKKDGCRVQLAVRIECVSDAMVYSDTLPLGVRWVCSWQEGVLVVTLPIDVCVAVRKRLLNRP